MTPGDAGRLADFAAFVAEQMTNLLRYAHALTGDRRQAEDLVQEALIRTGLGWHRVRRKDRPAAYVKTAILRLYLNERRRSNRPVPLAGYDLDNGAPDPGFGQVDEQDALKQALAQVPPKMRAVLVLRYLDGLPDDEIATVLDCSRGTVRTQAIRGLAKLRVAYLDGVARHEA